MDPDFFAICFFDTAQSVVQIHDLGIPLFFGKKPSHDRQPICGVVNPRNDVQPLHLAVTHSRNTLALASGA